MKNIVYRRIWIARLFTFAFCLLPFALYSQLTLTPSITPATCPADSNGSISVLVSGGTAPYTYQWLPDGQTSSAITGLKPGTYSVMVTDNSLNTASAICVVGPAPITDNAQWHAPICTNNGNIFHSPTTGGTPPYSYLWNDGQTTYAAAGLGAGNYSVIVTDANNCTASFSYILTEEECFISPDQYFTPNGDNINDTWFILHSQYYDNMHLIVFDRWGTRVHEQRGTYEPWNGKSYLGIPVPVSVYYYFFYLDADDKQKEAISGSVTLMR